MIALVAALALTVQGPGPSPAPTNSTNEPTPIRITLIGGAQYTSGDRVRVQVQTEDDGYLVVLRVDTDGHIRVLFPIDPDLDPFVRGGKMYELRGRADRQTFLADEHNGTGVILAAVSHDPMHFRDFSLGDHWDYDALRLRDNSDDTENDLSRIVARMTGNLHFDYDILNYTVTGPYISAVGGAYPVATNTYYGGYDPYWSCLACTGYRPIGFGTRIGFGGYNSFYDPWGYNYDPFFYDPYYYGYAGYYPGSYWRYPGQSFPLTVVNLPRPHIPTSPYGLRSRPHAVIPVQTHGLLGPSRSGGMGSGSSVGSNAGNNNGSTSPGRYVGDRTRQAPASRPPSRDPEPRSSASPPPRVDRTPPSSSGSGSSGSGSSGSSGSTGTRSRPRGGGDVQDASTTNPGQRAIPVSIDRRNDEPRPVFREPARMQPPTAPPRDNTPPQSRPVYREPPRVERSAPPRDERSAPPREERAPPRVERSAPPPPPPSVRSSPPPPPPKSSGGGSTSSPPRSRQGGGGH